MIEIIAVSLEDALLIEQAGADRIELVSEMDQEGLSPDLELVKKITETIKIPINVMVRPHNSGFEYTDFEFEEMLLYIEHLKKYDVNAIVWGSLKDGCLNEKQLKVIQTIWQGHITFHRAIDVSKNPKQMFKTLSEKSINQILTSGGPGKAIEHLNILDDLYHFDAKKLLIGSGVSSDNIERLKNRYPKANFHIGTGARLSRRFDQSIDVEKVKEIVRIDKIIAQTI